MTKKSRSDRFSGAAAALAMRHSGAAPFLLICATVVGLLVQGACLIAPPLDLEEPAENHPPFIHASRVRPETNVIVASSNTNITLGVDTVYDLDDELELYYAWYSPTFGTLTTGSLASQLGVPADNYGVFYPFDGTSYELSPCLPELRGRQSETIWLYITDRQWAGTSRAGVQVKDDEGAFLAAWSWVIDLRGVTCEG